ncbi:MAG: PAS domain S-box protein, partial [Chloroflexota bacterium]|nr:PAS domain S-box protein [Chloroflexota bacterium]
GYRHDDVIGKSFVEIGLLEMESLPMMLEMLQGSIRISHLEAVEAKRKDGSEAVVDVYLSLIENGGKLKGILVTMKDITKYTEAEESLRVSRAEMDLWMEERAEKLAKIEKDLQTQISERKKIEDSMTELKARWRSLEESAVNIIMIVNRDGKIISMNRMMADALPQQTMGQKVYDYLAPEYHQVMSTAINRVFTFGAPEGCQFIGLGPDSGYSSYEARLGPIRSDGQISAVLLIINDITERMGAEESLKEAEQRFRDLANMLPQTVFEIDLNGNFTFANNFGLQYTGYIQDDIDKGLNALQLFAPEDRGRVLWNIERALTGQEFGSHEYTALRKDESTFRVMAHTSPIIRNGKIVGMRGIILDITDRIQAEEEIRIKNEELVAVHAELQELNQNLEAKVNERTSEVKNLLKNKEDFISQLGHDLRSPMMPLVGLLPMIQERETDAESKELLGVIAENVEFMSNLIEETLALASLDSLDVGFNTCDVKLSEVLSDLIVRKQNACEQNGIAVENTVGDEVTVAVNKQRLDEVLDKLISNAIKFTPDGGTLTFAARKDGEFVTVSARDTGIGLTDEQAVHVFEEFYKADESRHQLGAPGLGLTICERIVRKHGGEIWVESEGLGKGTTVYFTIPIATDRSE